jgi:hypothetical protein
VGDNGTSDCFNNSSYSNGAIHSLGHNLVENNVNCTLAASDLTHMDPRLKPLANNGGATQTMALGAGSPALDNGSNALVPGGVTTDQRGTGFARILDASDLNTTDEVDIGALEQHPSVEDVADQTINEDGSLSLSFNLGDADLGFDSVTAVSANTTLVPNNAANISLSGSGSSRTLTVNPVANRFGSTTISLTVSDTVAGTAQAMTDTFVLTVTPIADTPSVTNAATSEDTQTSSGLVVSRNPADGAEVTHFKITNITNGALFKSDGTTQITNNSFITFAEAHAGLKFTPAANLFGPSIPFSFDVQASTSNANAGLGGNVVTASITVAPVADTPSVTNAQTAINTQTTSGLVVSRNPADGAEVTHFKITNIMNGTLFQHDGTTPINTNDFITVAQGNAGLRFTPAIGFAGMAHITVRASTAADDSGLGGSPVTADITVGSPTAVTLASFTARQDAAERVIVRWRTAADARILGFNLWRRVRGSASFERLNRKLIPARRSTNDGHSYTYIDRRAESRRAYVYKLQIVNLAAAAVWAPAVVVRP